MASARKVAVTAAAVLVVAGAFAAGAVAGTGDGHEGSGGWQERLAGFGGGAELTAADLEVVDGTCTVASTTISVTGGCTLEVSGSGGFLGLGSPTKRAHVENVSSVRVGLVLGVEDRSIRATLEAHQDSDSDDPASDETDVTFGRSGGTFRIECSGLLPSQECTLALT